MNTPAHIEIEALSIVIYNTFRLNNNSYCPLKYYIKSLHKRDQYSNKQVWNRQFGGVRSE